MEGDLEIVGSIQQYIYGMVLHGSLFIQSYMFIDLLNVIMNAFGHESNSLVDMREDIPLSGENH